MTMHEPRPLAAAAALSALALPATAAAKTTESFFSPRGGEALVALTAAVFARGRARGLVSCVHALVAFGAEGGVSTPRARSVRRRRARPS
jgi:hypothetical protein